MTIRSAGREQSRFGERNNVGSRQFSDLVRERQKEPEEILMRATPLLAAVFIVAGCTLAFAQAGGGGGAGAGGGGAGAGGGGAGASAGAGAGGASAGASAGGSTGAGTDMRQRRSALKC